MQNDDRDCSFIQSEERVWEQVLWGLAAVGVLLALGFFAGCASSQHVRTAKADGSRCESIVKGWLPAEPSRVCSADREE